MYEAHNIKPLAFWTEGAMAWTGNRELRTPAEFARLSNAYTRISLILDRIVHTVRIHLLI